MRLAALGFALGVWLLQRQPELPGYGWALAGVVAAGALVVAPSAAKRIAPLAAALAICAFAIRGFSWAAVLSELRLAAAPRTRLVGRDIPLDPHVSPPAPGV